MLSLFPSLLSYQELSPFLIRIALAVVFLFFVYRELRFGANKTTKKAVAAVETIAALLVLVGLWTQLGALVLAIDLIIRLIERAQKKALLTDGVNYYLILLVMAISLLVTGAGWWAFDIAL